MASTSMAATATLMPCRLPSTTTANYPPPCSSLPSLPPLLLSTPAFSTSLKQLSQAASSEESSPPVDAGKLFSDLKEKVRSKPGTIPKKRKLETISQFVFPLLSVTTSFDLMEDKSTVILYGGGAIVAVWLSSIFIGAINSVPLLPKLMELVRLGYTGWFVYRCLLFKDSRKEIATDIEALKKFPGTE
ncbi:hypothetical protein CsSME_00023785 [Camellia sinensis var. sinensis]